MGQHHADRENRYPGVFVAIRMRAPTKMKAIS
jgi:hypothetical protein